MGRPSRNLHTHVVDELGRRIVTGEYPPGHALDPGHLEAQLEVSHTVLREALRALGEKGLVEARPRRGTLVRPRSAWNFLDRDVLTWRYENGVDLTLLRDLAEVRQSLEPTAARLAARRHSGDDLEELDTALAAMHAAGRDSQRLIAADLAFHRALFRAAHNEVIGQMGMIVEIGLRARDQAAHRRPDWHNTAELHDAVAEAVRLGDEAGAQAAMLHLLDESQKTLEHPERELEERH